MSDSKPVKKKDTQSKVIIILVGLQQLQRF